MGWDELRYECSRCERCSLCGTRRNVVFGEGVEDAEVMFVGEGPGEVEDNTGRPFVGPAGQFLDEMLDLIGLGRNKNCYIANIVKCRPPNNRDPLSVEQDACIGWLNAQIELVQPKIIVCLGRIAAGVLIKEDFRITREHGLIFEREGVKYMAIYHPSALLRDPSRRPETFADLRRLRSLVRDCCEKTPI